MQLGHAVGASDVNRVEMLCADALRRDPKDLMALMMLADTYWREERSTEALSYALQVLELDPSTFQALRIVADVYAKRGDHDRAYGLAASGSFAWVACSSALSWLPKRIARYGSASCLGLGIPWSASRLVAWATYFCASFAGFRVLISSASSST